MRVNRIVTAIIAFALMGFIPLATSPASAAPTAEPAAVSAASSDVHARAALKVGAKIVRRNGRLVMFGYVNPARGPARIQKATKCNRTTGNCNWRSYRVVSVKKMRDGRGRYSVRVSAPANGSWYWRAKVRTAYSDVWRTFRA